MRKVCRNLNYHILNVARGPSVRWFVHCLHHEYKVSAHHFSFLQFFLLNKALLCSSINFSSRPTTSYNDSTDHARPSFRYHCFKHSRQGENPRGSTFGRRRLLGTTAFGNGLWRLLSYDYHTVPSRRTRY